MSERDQIVPDAKDWTWVLAAPCGECGLDTGTIAGTEVAGLLRANAARWPGLLADPTSRARPNPSTWSTLEYACHVRDVFVLYDQRLVMMLTEDDPLYPNWDQDQAAVAGRYHEQDPAQVGEQLLTAGAALANRFDTVTGGQWQRPGRRSDGAVFTVESFARYLLHDPVHHLADVTGG